MFSCVVTQWGYMALARCCFESLRRNVCVLGGRAYESSKKVWWRINLCWSLASQHIWKAELIKSSASGKRQAPTSPGRQDQRIKLEMWGRRPDQGNTDSFENLVEFARNQWSSSTVVPCLKAHISSLQGFFICQTTMLSMTWVGERSIQCSTPAVSAEGDQFIKIWLHHEAEV